MYDPILCVNVPDSVKMKDSIYSDIHGKITKENANAVLYNLLEDARRTSNKSELKRIINEVKQIIKKVPYRDDNSVSSSTIEMKLRQAQEKLNTMKDSVIDKAIRNCDATSVSQAKSGLKTKIDGWYKNAKIDYGVNGKFVDVREESSQLVVYWEEEGKRKRYSFGKYWDDYSVNELYNIWMEQAD